MGSGLLVLHACSVPHKTTHGPEGGTLSSAEISREQRVFLIISLNHLLQSAMKDNNNFIESSLTIRDVSNIAPAEIQTREMCILSSLQIL